MPPEPRLQRRPPRFRASDFLNALHDAYQVALTRPRNRLMEGAPVPLDAEMLLPRVPPRLLAQTPHATPARRALERRRPHRQAQRPPDALGILPRRKIPAHQRRRVAVSDIAVAIMVETRGGLDRNTARASLA